MNLKDVVLLLLVSLAPGAQADTLVVTAIAGLMPRALVVTRGEPIIATQH